MRDYLTIGELGKLLNVSAHTIRYYEKEGLLKPSKISSQGYRLYDTMDTHNLSLLITLRDSHIPIKTIKGLVDDFNKEEYIQLVKNSHHKISDEIKRLKILQDELQKILDFTCKVNLNKLRIIEFKQRSFHTLQICQDKSCSIKDVYDTLLNNDFTLNNIYNREHSYYYVNNKMYLCIEEDNKPHSLNKLSLAKGNYLCYTCNLDSQSEINTRTKELLSYVNQNNINISTGVFVKILNCPCLASHKSYIAEFQLLLTT